MAATYRIRGRRGLFTLHSWSRRGDIWLYGPLNDQQRQYVAVRPDRLDPPPPPRPKPQRQMS